MSLPLTYKSNNCFINAYINSRHALKHLGLKYKIGALGLNGWFEYGGKNWTKKDYFKKNDGSYCFDAHAWLEDSEGNVYDYVFESYDSVAKIRTKKGLEFLGEIRGVSKAELKSKGLEYVEADRETQTAIFLKTLEMSRDSEQGLLTGQLEWIGFGEDAMLGMTFLSKKKK